MPIVEANAAKLHFETLGTKDPPVVMLHGLMASLFSWYFGPAARLSKQHRVILYDLRGHGSSERTRQGYGLDSMAADLAGIVDSVAGQPVYLVAHSYGCSISMRYALDHPDKVKGLFLIEVPFPLSASPDEFEQLRVLRNLAKEFEPGGDWLSAIPADILEQMKLRLPEGMASAIEGKYSSVVNRALNQSFELVKETDLADELLARRQFSDGELAGLPAKTVLCYAADSPKLISRDQLIAQLPQAKVEYVAGGHFILHEPAATARITSLIEDFLNG